MNIVFTHKNAGTNSRGFTYPDGYRLCLPTKMLALTAGRRNRSLRQVLCLPTKMLALTAFFCFPTFSRILCLPTKMLALTAYSE